MTDVDRMQEQWGRARPTLDTEALGIVARLAAVHRAAGEAAARALGPLGLTPADLDVLAALRRVDEPYALTPSALATELSLTSGGVTLRVDRVEARGWARRIPTATDRRSLQVLLTPDGVVMADRGVDAVAQAQAGLLAPLPAGTRRQLDDLLRQALRAAALG